MDAPLGRAAGNWLEVKESVECLEGQGPDDLRKLVISCAAHLLVQAGKVKSVKTGEREAGSCLASGEPRRKWDEMIAAQGADLSVFKKKLALDHTAPVVLEVNAARAGFVSQCDARTLGEVIRDLGGGRANKESVINYDVGIDRLAKPGEKVGVGSIVARVHAADAKQAKAAAARIETAFSFVVRVHAIKPLISDVVIAPTKRVVPHASRQRKARSSRFG